MAHIRQILANLSISVAEFKQSPKTVIKAAKNEPIAVIINDRPAFYCVPADILESLYQKVYEMNDMSLQNIEQLDTEEPLSPDQANDEFGTNDVFEAIEDEHEAKRNIHNESLVDPLNTQVADPLDEEVAHQINLSIDQHLKNLHDQALSEDYDVYDDEFDDDEDEDDDDDDDDIPPQRTSSYGRFVKAQGSPRATSARSLTGTRSSQRACTLNTYGQRTNLLDKFNNLDPNLNQDFAYPYSPSGTMLDKSGDGSKSNDLTLNQAHSKLELSNVATQIHATDASDIAGAPEGAELDDAATTNAAITTNAANTTNTTNMFDVAAGALSDFGQDTSNATRGASSASAAKRTKRTSSANNADGATSKTSRRKTSAKSRTTTKAQAQANQGTFAPQTSPLANALATSQAISATAKRKNSRKTKSGATGTQDMGHDITPNSAYTSDAAWGVAAQQAYADAYAGGGTETDTNGYAGYQNDYHDAGFEDFAVSGSIPGPDANDANLANIDPVMHTNYANRRLEDKATLREIISDVKQEIKDSMHARRLIRNPYDMPLDKVARTYSPYATPDLTDNSGDTTQVRKNTRRKKVDAPSEDKAKQHGKLSPRPAPLTQAAKMPIRRKSAQAAPALSSALSSALSANAQIGAASTVAEAVSTSTSLAASTLSSTGSTLSSTVSTPATLATNVASRAVTPNVVTMAGSVVPSAQAGNTASTATMSTTAQVPESAQDSGSDQAKTTKTAKAAKVTKPKTTKSKTAKPKAAKATNTTKAKVTKGTKDEKGASDSSDVPAANSSAVSAPRTKRTTRTTSTTRTKQAAVDSTNASATQGTPSTSAESKTTTADKRTTRAASKAKVSTSTSTSAKAQAKAQTQTKAKTTAQATSSTPAQTKVQAKAKDKAKAPSKSAAKSAVKSAANSAAKAPTKATAKTTATDKSAAKAQNAAKDEATDKAQSSRSTKA